MQAGEHVPAKIDTPWNYPGVAGAPAESGWYYELSHPGATYVAIHFKDFDLAPGDYLIVSDPPGEQTYFLEDRGKMDAGGTSRATRFCWSW